MATFSTELWSNDGHNTGIEVPPAVVEAFGRGKRVPVTVTVNGSHRYRSTITSMGGRFLIPFAAEHRTATGLGIGDAVEVQLEVDEAPRTVEPPAELAAQIAGDAIAIAAWAALAPSKQKQHALAIEGAKAAETRARRIAAVRAILRDEN